MEVLGNEALGKIIKLVDEKKFLSDLECKTFSGDKAEHPGSILNILSAGGPGMYLLLHILHYTHTAFHTHAGFYSAYSTVEKDLKTEFMVFSPGLGYLVLFRVS